MKSISLHVAALLALAVGFGSPAVTAAESNAVVKLKKEIRIKGDRIHLEDVADLSGPTPDGLAQLELGHAPWPGHARRVSPELIGMRSVTAGLDPSRLRIEGADICIVRRAVQKVSSEDIVGAARSYLRKQLPEKDCRVEMTLLNRVEPVSVAEGDGKLELRAAHSGNGMLTGRVTVTVSILRSEKEIRSVPVRFRVSLYRKTAVAAEDIAISEPVTAARVTWKRRAVSGSSGTCITSKDQLRDRLAARPISPGQVITKNMLKEQKSPICVKPQQHVQLVVETDVLRVTTEGKALAQGRKGETITAVNLKTGRKVSGTITGKGKVNVHM